MAVFPDEVTSFCQIWLSKSSQIQGQLDGRRRRDGFNPPGILEPGEQVAIGEEIEAKHGGEVGEGPGDLGKVMQPLEDQDGNQGCPNLDAQGVLALTNKGFDLEGLLERFEEQLDLPAVLVDVRDGAGLEVMVIGQQGELSLVLLVPDHDTTQERGASLGCFGSGETDRLIRQDGKVLWHRLCRHNLVLGIVFEPGDEEDTLVGPSVEQGVVDVPAIHDHDGVGVGREQPQSFDVVQFRLGDMSKDRQIRVMIKTDMDLDPSFGFAELGPGEQGQAQRDRRGVEGDELVLEPELRLAHPQFTACLESGVQGEEQILVQFPGTMGVGIGQGRTLGRPLYAEVPEFTQTALEPVRDLAQGVRVG